MFGWLAGAIIGKKHVSLIFPLSSLTFHTNAPPAFHSHSAPSFIFLPAHTQPLQYQAPAIFTLQLQSPAHSQPLHTLSPCNVHRAHRRRRRTLVTAWVTLCMWDLTLAHTPRPAAFVKSAILSALPCNCNLPQLCFAFLLSRGDMSMFNELGGFRKAACVKLTCTALQSFLCRRQKLILSAQCIAAVSSWQCAVFTVHPPDFLTFSAKHPLSRLATLLAPLL